MGVFDKLAFWKKKDDFADLKSKDPFGPDMGQPPGPDSGFGGPDPFASPPGMPQHHDPGMGDPNSPLMNPPSPQFPPEAPPGYQPPGGMSPPPPSADSDYINSKNLEVISSKIDAIRATLDSINARLSHIEHLAGAEDEQRKRRYY